MRADKIKTIIGNINDLPYKTILFDGTWGVRKSYAVNEELAGNPDVCKISMFGMTDARQIYHEVLFQLALKNNVGGKIGEIANNIIEGAAKVWDKVGQARDVVQNIANERELFLLLSKEFTFLHIVVIDDLERMNSNMNLEEIFGIIEELKQCNYVKVILVANTAEMSKDKKEMERGAIQVKRNNDTGKEMWRPMPRKDLMNRSDAEIVSTFNSEIRGLYNFYRIAENVGALHKYYYMVRYSMLKTLAGKHRTNVSVIKKRHMVNGVLRIPYDTTKGRKYCEFYHDGFRKHSDGYDNVADVMPSYRKYDSRHTIVNRIKAGVCEICGEHADYLCMHHVRTLKSLKGRDIFEQKMLKMRRKSLALCPDCFELLHETKESR